MKKFIAGFIIFSVIFLPLPGTPSLYSNPPDPSQGFQPPTQPDPSQNSNTQAQIPDPIQTLGDQTFTMDTKEHLETITDSTQLSRDITDSTFYINNPADVKQAFLDTPLNSEDDDWTQDLLDGGTSDSRRTRRNCTQPHGCPPQTQRQGQQNATGAVTLSTNSSAASTPAPFLKVPKNPGKDDASSGGSLDSRINNPIPHLNPAPSGGNENVQYLDPTPPVAQPKEAPYYLDPPSQRDYQAPHLDPLRSQPPTVLTRMTNVGTTNTTNFPPYLNPGTPPNSHSGGEGDPPPPINVGGNNSGGGNNGNNNDSGNDDPQSDGGATQGRPQTANNLTLAMHQLFPSPSIFEPQNTSPPGLNNAPMPLNALSSPTPTTTIVSVIEGRVEVMPNNPKSSALTPRSYIVEGGEQSTVGPPSKPGDITLTPTVRPRDYVLLPPLTGSGPNAAPNSNIGPGGSAENALIRALKGMGEKSKKVEGRGGEFIHGVVINELGNPNRPDQVSVLLPNNLVPQEPIMGNPMPEKTLVQTLDNNAFVSLYHQGQHTATVYVNENTTVQFTTLESDVQNPTVPRTALNLSIGSVLNVVEHQNGQPHNYTVTTAEATATVRGTIFWVVVEAKK